MSEMRTPGGRPRGDSGIDDTPSLVSDGPGWKLTAGQKIGIAGLLAVVCVGLIWLQALNKTAQEPQQPDMPHAGAGGTFRPAPQATPTPATFSMPLPTPSASPAQALLPLAPQHEMTPAESPIFAFIGGGGVPAATASSPASLVSAPVGMPPGSDNAVANRLKPTVLSGSKARLLPHPDMLVTEGTIIPCILQTAIDTQLAGYVKCVLPQAVRGTTGNVVLLDRGTTVVGEIQSGLMQGQNRVFVLWDRAETPDHAVIQLDSPGTDALGRSGLPGAVNNHIWQRFGGAIMLSVIQGGLETATALAANSGSRSGTFFNSFQSNGANVADTALQATINIPPTLEKNQGDTIAIFVARDLDMSDVYSLRVTGRADGQ